MPISGLDSLSEHRVCENVLNVTLWSFQSRPQPSGPSQHVGWPWFTQVVEPNTQGFWLPCPHRTTASPVPWPTSKLTCVCPSSPARG